MSTPAVPRRARNRRATLARAGVILLPVLEILAIVGVGKLVGVWWTLGLLVAGSAAGGVVIAAAGRSALGIARTVVQTGEVPGRRLPNAVLTGVGGLLLLVPGFLTDVLGLLFVIPPTRSFARRMLGALAARHGTRMLRSAGAGPLAGPLADTFGRSTGGQGPVVPTDVVASRDEPTS